MGAELKVIVNNECEMFLDSQVVILRKLLYTAVWNLGKQECDEVRWWPIHLESHHYMDFLTLREFIISHVKRVQMSI